MKTKILLKLSNDQITGFSYSFAKSLLDRLLLLFEQGQLYERFDSQMPSRATTLTRNLIHYLDLQIPHVVWRELEIPNFDPVLWEEDNKKFIDELCSKNSKIINEGYNFLKTFELEK